MSQEKNHFTLKSNSAVSHLLTLRNKGLKKTVSSSQTIFTSMKYTLTVVVLNLIYMIRIEMTDVEMKV